MEPSSPDTAAALDKVDVSVVETLTAIRQDQDGVRQLLAKATERKDKVSPEVYARVAKDYEGRLSALEDRARPLREKARAQLVELMKLHTQIKSNWQAAQLAQQELEFRHEVGELSPEDFEPRRKTSAAAVEERQRTFERADTLRQRFEGVLPPQTAAAPPPAAPAPAPAPGPGPAPAPAPVPVVAAPPPPPPPTAAPPDRTESMPLPSMPPQRPPAPAAPVPAPAAPPPPPAPPSAAPAPPSPATGEMGTVMVVLKPKLVEEVAAGGAGRTFVLGGVTTVGRTPDNHINADVRELSRHHARIEPRDGGFVIVDLNSGNGTFVNTKRITEHRLAPGDRIQLGTLRFVYHAG